MKLPFKSLWAEFKAFAFKGNMIELAVAVVIGGAFGKVIDSLVKDIVMPAVSYVQTGVSEVKDTTTNVAKIAAEKAGVLTTQPATRPTTEPASQPTTAAAVGEPTVVPPGGAPAIVVAVPATQPALDEKDAGAVKELVVVLKREFGDVKKDVAPAAAPPAEPKPVDLSFDVGRFKVGDFIASLLNFVIIAFAVFILIVKVMGSAMASLNRKPAEPSEPTTKECPECLSIIPYKAKRCPNCTSILTPPANP